MWSRFKGVTAVLACVGVETLEAVVPKSADNDDAAAREGREARPWAGHTLVQWVPQTHTQTRGWG